MSKRVSREDVARRSGVSKTTVSYVLSGKANSGIPEITRKKVLDAAAELGYIPNRAAQSLRTGKTKLIGLWMSVLGPPYYAAIVDTVQDILREYGYEMMVADTAPHPDWEAHLERLSGWPVDGIIAFDSPRYVQAFLERFGPMAPPISTMGVATVESCDHVVLDLQAGSVAAMDHLMSLNRSRVAFLSDAIGMTGSDPRFEAYRDAINKAHALPEIISIPQRSRRCAYEAMLRYVKTNGHPGAIFCFNDDLAIGSLRALLDLGLSVPDDVALVGHDGIDDTEFCAPRLTTVGLDSRAMCEIAWRHLHARLEEPTLPLQAARLTSNLIARESTLGRSVPASATLPR